MSSQTRVLCEIRGQTVCCILNHRGKGYIWVDYSESKCTVPLAIAQAVTLISGFVLIGISLTDEISLGILVSGCTLIGWNFVIFMFGRNLYEKAGWNVNIRRTIFRIPITKAIERSIKYINRQHRKTEKAKGKAI